jgi:hypothetical protein
VGGSEHRIRVNSTRLATLSQLHSPRTSTEVLVSNTLNAPLWNIFPNNLSLSLSLSLTHSLCDDHELADPVDLGGVNREARVNKHLGQVHLRVVHVVGLVRNDGETLLVSRLPICVYRSEFMRPPLRG